MILTELPAEILNTILLQAKAKTLASVSCTCTSLHNIAFNLLYQNITLRTDYSLARLQPQSLRLIRALNRNEKARYVVKELQVEVIPPKNCLSLENLQVLIEMLSATLPNLKVFAWHGIPARTPLVFPVTIRDLTIDATQIPLAPDFCMLHLNRLQCNGLDGNIYAASVGRWLHRHINSGEVTKLSLQSRQLDNDFLKYVGDLTNHKLKSLVLENLDLTYWPFRRLVLLKELRLNYCTNFSNIFAWNRDLQYLREVDVRAYDTTEVPTAGVVALSLSRALRSFSLTVENSSTLLPLSLLERHGGTLEQLHLEHSDARFRPNPYSLPQVDMLLEKCLMLRTLSICMRAARLKPFRIQKRPQINRIRAPKLEKLLIHKSPYSQFQCLFQQLLHRYKNILREGCRIMIFTKGKKGSGGSARLGSFPSNQVSCKVQDFEYMQHFFR